MFSLILRATVVLYIDGMYSPVELKCTDKTKGNVVQTLIKLQGDRVLVHNISTTQVRRFETRDPTLMLPL